MTESYNELYRITRKRRGVYLSLVEETCRECDSNLIVTWTVRLGTLCTECPGCREYRMNRYHRVEPYRPDQDYKVGGTK